MIKISRSPLRRVSGNDAIRILCENIGTEQLVSVIIPSGMASFGLYYIRQIDPQYDFSISQIKPV